MIDPELARRIRLVGLDVDGVLTDGAVYMGMVAGESTEFKRFDIQDGIGIKLMQDAGIRVVWLSGRESPATLARARDIGIADVIQDDSARKLPALEALLGRLGIGFEETAFLGDDLPDIPVLRRVALPVAVPNAAEPVKALARYITRSGGGFGAVREFAEALLRARGEWDLLVERYLRERGERMRELDRAG
jgi:3-deoxy-D-manno-octulosonate 8-phosphate phosphatase (KDO 8-P phosphatase)